MGIELESEFNETLENFNLIENEIDIQPIGSGHINDTYLITPITKPYRNYVLQRLNHQVFEYPHEVMANIKMVCDHIKAKTISNVDDRFILEVVNTKSGDLLYKDSQGNYWRMYNHIPNSTTIDLVKTKNQAFEAARTYGEFTKFISDLDPKNFSTPIPEFHNIEKRYQALTKSVANNTVDRCRHAQEEIEIAFSVQSISDRVIEGLEMGELPIHVTHNDTKINNVLLDKITGKGICVIDLDTVMPGTLVYDFGDMVRTFVSPVEEDEPDLSKVDLRMDIFQSMCQGYLAEVANILTATEKSLLIDGAKLMTLIMAVRFLTDFLEGDIYYKTGRKEHNLDRCRNQLHLLHLIIKKENELNRVINSLSYV